MTNKNLTRVPKSLAYDYKMMERTFSGGSGKLITDLLIFLSNAQMTNIFGKIQFTIEEFCKKMNYHRTDLQRILTDEERKAIMGDRPFPIYLKETGQEDKFEHLICNYFECAIWQAMNQNMTFAHRNPSGGTSLTSVQIIEHFEIDYDHKTEKKNKRLYSVKIGYKLKDYLMNQYNLIELKDYSNLPNRDGYRIFYIYLSRMIVQIKWNILNKKAPYYVLTVDQLSDIFNCEAKRPADKKKIVQRTLDTINKYIEKANFKYDFFCDTGQKHAYSVKFEFPNETLAYFDEKNKAVFFSALVHATEKIFIETYYKGIQDRKERTRAYIAFRNELDENGNYKNRHLFWEWFHSEENQTEKKAIYDKVFFEIFKMESFNIFPNE